MIVQVPFAYHAHVVRTGKRAAEGVDYNATVDVAVPDVSSDEASLACRVVHADGHAVEYRAYDGVLLAPVQDEDQDVQSVVRKVARKALPASHVRWSAADDRDVLRTTWSGREGREDKIRASVDKYVVVDGRLWGPSHVPFLRVEDDGGVGAVRVVDFRRNSSGMPNPVTDFGLEELRAIPASPPELFPDGLPADAPVVEVFDPSVLRADFRSDLVMSTVDGTIGAMKDNLAERDVPYFSTYMALRDASRTYKASLSTGTPDPTELLDLVQEAIDMHSPAIDAPGPLRMDRTIQLRLDATRARVQATSEETDSVMGMSF